MSASHITNKSATSFDTILGNAGAICCDDDIDL